MFQLILCFILVYYGKYILIGYVTLILIINTIRRL